MIAKQRLIRIIGIASFSSAAVSILSGCNTLSQVVDSTAGTVCGDARCEAGETEANCPQDCVGDNPIGCGKGCSTNAHCNDGNPCTDDRCTAGKGLCEGAMVCENPAVQCPDGQSCVSGACVATVTDDMDGEPVCGDRSCDPGETEASCPQDCPDAPIGCGKVCSTNAQCDDGDSCTIDTCTPGTGLCAGTMICTNTPVQCPEGQTCSNGACSNP